MSKEIQLLKAARRAGKTMFSDEQLQHIEDALERAIIKMNQKFELVDQGPVDDAPWYTVVIRDNEIWFWLSQQEGQWHHYTCEHTRRTLVDMDEATYLALVMRWS